MQAAAQEAVTAQQADVAKCALLELQKILDQDPVATVAPGDRATVLVNLVRIIQDTPDQTVKGMAESAEANHSLKYAGMLNPCWLYRCRIRTGHNSERSSSQVRASGLPAILWARCHRKVCTQSVHVLPVS